MTNREKNTKRRTYSKPVLRFIDLVAEEVLTVGCKTSTGGGKPGGFSCTSNGCSSAGS